MIVDPVGKIIHLDEIEIKLNELIAKWQAENPAPTGWFGRTTSAIKISFAKMSRFLIDSLDELIVIIEDMVDLGPDKKATVMNAVSKLYDNIVAPALPLWAKPFNSAIKNVMVNVIVSSSIDFIVSKYEAGSWNAEVATTS